MNNYPLVSTIIPTYNRLGLVNQAIDSVLKQTYPNVEIIVVDDGSTDDTAAQLLKCYGDKIQVLTQANAGPAAARNRGIAVSHGELIAFLDSDDIWLPAKLARQVALLQVADKSVPCCLCNITMQWHDGERGSFEIAGLSPTIDQGIWLNADEVLATRFLLINQGVVVRREVLERIGGFDESLRLLEDHELALRLSLQGPWAFVREPLVIWHETRSGSLYQAAKQNEISWRDRMISVLESHLANVKGSNNERVRRNLTRELKRNRRCRQAAKISGTDFWGASAVGHLLAKLEHYRRAIFVRSPWFPTMKIRPLGT